MRSALRMLAAAAIGGLLIGLPALASAAPLPQPTEKPILIVSGKIANTNKDGTAQFDRPMLEKLGDAMFSTTTPWYDGPHKFEGVPLTKLLEAVGAFGDKITATALNDYATDIPIEDAKKGAILALKRDGQYMPVSDKGPIFIIYPFDSSPDLKAQVYYKRSAWQVSRIEVK